MTNEELATQIQRGEQDALPLLWTQVERFVAMQARKAARGNPEDFQDYYQSGFLALVDAAADFDPDGGKSFVGWLAYHLKNAFAEAGGYRTGRLAKDPIRYAQSLDAPILGTEDMTLADTVIDPDSLRPFEEAEDGIWQEQLRRELDKALDALKDHQSEVIRRRFYQGDTLREIAQDAGVTLELVRQRESSALRALRHPRITKPLRQFLDEHTAFYRSVGPDTFQRTHTSSVELAVLQREGLVERWRRDAVNGA